MSSLASFHFWDKRQNDTKYNLLQIGRFGELIGPLLEEDLSLV